MDLASWRDVSIIFLGIPAFVLTLMPLVLFFFLNKGLRQGIVWLRKTGFPEGQRLTRLVADRSREVSGKVAEPVMQVDTRINRIRATRDSIPAALRRRRQRSYHV